MAIDRLRFGIFMAPFHHLGDNPTLALRRDLDLIEWLDELGYDEAWIGEHHSAGWEIIAAPEVMIAAAAERTKRIMLGTGVTSLPYHHPFMVADRMVMLDHLTRGRAMLGVGPGALTSDAYMMGIDPETQRPRMDEALGAIMALLRAEEPVTMKTDWFELREARLQLLPFTRPYFPIAVANSVSPAGMIVAGKYGVGVLSIAGGAEMMARQWGYAEESAAEHRQTIRREDWRVVRAMHLAESREQAFREAEKGERNETNEYFGGIGAPPLTSTLEEVVRSGAAIVGTPDDAIAAIEHLIEQSGGGFGTLLFRAHEWAGREATHRSFELFARYVMPRFQGSLQTLHDSHYWVRGNKRTIFKPAQTAIQKAFTDAGKEIPPELLARQSGARVS